MPPTFDLAAFIEFVEGKPAGETYNPRMPGACALAQFGFPWLTRGRCHRFGVPMSAYAAAVIDCRTPEDATFGSLASRLAALPESGL